MLDITLTDLIDVEVLQKIQTGFSNYTKMAALTADANGNPVTEGSGFTDFCMNLTRTCDKGLERCKNCDKQGALLTLKNGGPVSYPCHAGLTDFAAPIMVEGEFIGSFIGGQALSAPLSEEKIRATARELGIDEDAYVKAASKVPIIEQQQIDDAATFLSEIAEILSEMAYNSYIALKQSKQLERIATSHNKFIIDMNNSMKKHVQDWIYAAKQLQLEDVTDRQKAILSKLMAKSSDFLATIDETVEFAELTRGEIVLKESEYNIEELLDDILERMQSLANSKNVKLSIKNNPDLPKRFWGDASRITQAITKIMQNIITNSNSNSIELSYSCSKNSYSTDTVFSVTCFGSKLSHEQAEQVNNFLKTDTYLDSSASISLSILKSLLLRLSATLSIEENGQGTVFQITVPQLTL